MPMPNGPDSRTLNSHSVFNFSQTQNTGTFFFFIKETLETQRAKQYHEDHVALSTSPEKRLSSTISALRVLHAQERVRETCQSA